MTISTDGVQRRTVLAGALAGTAVVAVPVLEPALAAATAVAGPGVNGLGSQAAALVHSKDGSAVRMPAELGALLTVGASGVAAGTALTITYDSRLYSAAPSAVLVSGERVIPVRAHPVASSTASGQLELRLPELSAGIYTVRAGGLVRDRYPTDLITDPRPTAVKLSEPGGAVTAQTLSKPAAKAGLPWGVQLGAGWLQAAWSDQYYAWHPATITVHSVGPGAIPAGSRIRVTLDGAVFESVSVSAASDSLGHKVNGLPRRTEVVGRPVATWTAPAAIPAGARITLTCTTVARKLTGALDWVEPPLVDFLPPKAGRDAQRLTTQESLTRMDDVYSAATRARFGPVS
ncbi:hypothetical protein [Kribbella ginsengisoli]|uniref:Ig-like domain-containing protein n=1 Tax=Kribbella ginsengisoli TaxID=363865 RepID=A0ABP6VWU8_9ACTN